MKTNKRILTLALLAAALVLGSCKNPLLSVGLGDKVDILPPGITIVPLDGVQNGAYIHGTVTVNGEVSDDVGVSTVTWMFTDDATSTVSPTGTATLDAARQNWSFVLDTTQPGALWADGEKTFIITVTDEAGKSTDTRMLLIFDNTPPSATFINPPDGASIYGQVNLRGASSDNTSLIKVEVRIGMPPSLDPDDGFTVIVGSKYDWVRSFSAEAYKEVGKAIDNGDGTWTLPIYVRVYDYAGNVSTNEPSDPADDLYPDDLKTVYGDALSFDPLKIPSFSLIIDSDMDKPTASIQTPRDSTTMAGTVVASGSCFDENPGMQEVKMRLMALEDDGTEIGYVRPDGTAIADPGWVSTTLTGGAYWQASLNEDENLYDVIASGAYALPHVHNGKLRIDVQPWDINNKSGNIQTVTFTLDQTIPRLENPLIEVDLVDHLAWDYLYVRGTIVLKATASDNSAVTSIKLSLDNGDTYGGELIGTYTTGGPAAYTLTKPINTLTDPQIPSAILSEKNGPISMVVKLQDDALHFNNWLVTLNLDNRYPDKNLYTGTSGNGHDPTDLHGDIGDSTSQVMGRCADTGSVSGINEVEVYLVNVAQDKIIDLTNGNLVAKGSKQFGESQTWEDYPTNDNCKLAIDWTKVGAVDHMQLTQNGSDVDWWAQMDTDAHNLPDGEIKIHYVAWDKAGNAVHDWEPGFIKNHAPDIETVTVGTDLDDNGTVDGDEKITYEPEDPPADPITGRNDLLYIKINTSTTGMNLPFTYSIKNTTPGEATELADTGTGVATIDISGGRFGGDGDGKIFTVKITDAVGIVAQNTVTVDIDNVDGEKPLITVLPIGAPADLLDWNANPVAGHIESIGISQYDNGGTPDADVSGTVMVRGTASDNVNVEEIWLSIDGGASFKVAHWAAGSLTNDVPEFNIFTETLTDGGHDITWDYKWNTAGITDVAKANVQLAFSAKDHTANWSLATDGKRQYDVVPYITQVDTVITGLISKDFARSAFGRYPVRAGETITIKGYNLKPAVTGIGAGNSDVRIQSTAQRNDNTKTPGLGSRGLVYAGVAFPYTTMTADISLPSADIQIGSGYLVVWVNGVPSLNARSGRSNSETNFVSQTGTDERWLTVWARTVFKTDAPYVASAPLANHAAYPSMRMNGNTPVFAYVNNVQGYGLAEYWNGAAEWEIYENWDLFTYTALDLNSSGTHAALYDINVVQSGSSNTPDDKGGILTTYFYQPPNTTWNGNSYFYRDYHVWLDNLFKSGVSAILGRYQYPDLDMTSNSTTAISKVYYSVYDSIDDKVLVRAFNVGTDNVQVGVPVTNKITDNGANIVYTNIAQQNQNGTWPTYTDAEGNNRRFLYLGPGSNAGISPPNAYTVDALGAGPWTAVGATSGGVAVVAWYDTDTNALKYAYNAAADVSGAGTFVGTQVLDTYCGGDFVDIAVDASDHIHIAYHDSYSGDLMYVYLSAYNAAPDGPYVVDSYLTVGNKAGISVSAAGVPYITYKGMGNTAKAAWLVGSRGDGADASGKFNGVWEVQVLPTRIIDNDTNRFCMGVDSSTLPVVGYTNDGIEFVRRIADLP